MNQPSLVIPTFDFRDGVAVRRFACPSQRVKGRFKIMVIERACVNDRRKTVAPPPGGERHRWVLAHERPWQKNLILDQGLDKIGSNVWADVFLRCAAGTGNTPVSDDSGATTASQSGTAVTLSAGLGAVSAGKLIRWDTNEEALVVSGSGTSWTVDRSQTVSAGQFTVYRVDQTGLTAEVSGGSGRTSTYLTGSPDCDSTRSGGVFTMTRTYDFASPSGSTNYAEVGVSESATQTTNLFSRMLITGGSVTVLTTQQLRISYQLQLTVSPITPASATASISGWPVAPATDTDGTQQMGFIGLSKVKTDGTSGSWDGFNTASQANEPAHANDVIFLSPSSTAHSSYPDSPDRRTNAITKTASLVSYSNGNFFRDKTATFAAGEANRTDWRSMGLGNSNFGISDLTFCFLFGQAQTKDNTHTLQLTFRFSWGRDLS